MNPDSSVGTIMHKGVIGCKPSTPLEEVVRLMADTNLQILVITGPDEEALGTISQLDLIPYFGKELIGLRARDIMGQKVIAIPPSMPVAEAANIMLRHNITHLVVSERGDVGLRALGTLSCAHIIREMRGSKWIWYFSPEP